LVDKIIFRARKSRWEQILQGLGSEWVKIWKQRNMRGYIGGSFIWGRTVSFIHFDHIPRKHFTLCTPITHMFYFRVCIYLYLLNTYPYVCSTPWVFHSVAFSSIAHEAWSK
jgi:hypothetical protein